VNEISSFWNDDQGSTYTMDTLGESLYYSGTPEENVKEFILKFEAIAKEQKWVLDWMKVHHLKNYLRGAGLYWYHYELKDVFVEDVSWEYIKRELMKVARVQRKQRVEAKQCIDSPDRKK
jgi:hypothetical protein